MIRKRPLFTACLLFLIVQAVRVSCLGAGNAAPTALECAAAQSAEVQLTGTVSRIEKKTNTTAVFLKDAAVSLPSRMNTVASGAAILADGSGELVTEGARILAYVRPEQMNQKLKIGNQVRISGELQSFETARNPGNFDQKAYYQRQGVQALVWPDRVDRLSEDTDLVRQSLSELKSAWNQLLVRCLGDYYGGTMSAVLLGEKSGLDGEMKKMYQKSGIGHLLAVSGLHMSFIGMGIYRLLRRAGVGFVPAGLAGGVILAVYTLMIGAGVSSLRAVIMFLVRIGADMSGRDYDLLTSLALAAALLIWHQPLYLTDAGFLLSFGAILGLSVLEPVFGCMFGSPGTREGAGAAGKLISGLSASLAVNVLLLGPVLYFYYEIPPYSIFLNLLVIPVMPAAMGAGMLGSALTLISEQAGGAVFLVCRGILWLYDQACAAAGTLPGSRYVAGQPGLWWLIVYYGGLVILCGTFYFLQERREREEEEETVGSQARTGVSLAVRAPGICILLFAAGMTAVCRAGYQKSGEVRTVVLDVGQGDGIHICGPAGNYFIDGGSSDVSDPGACRIEPYLLACAADTLDYVFITHGDEDHISGIRELLAGQKLGIRIRSLVLPPKEYHDEKLTELARTAQANGTRVVTMRAGDQLKSGGLTMTCLGPEEGAGLEPGNAASLVLGLSYGDFDLLLTGDVEGEGEKSLIASGRLQEYDVIKAAHHGSKNSGSEEFLKIVRPGTAVISAGKDNRYGHPHSETLLRLEGAGCRIFSTQECGAVQIWTDGKRMTVHSFLDQTLVKTDRVPI